MAKDTHDLDVLAQSKNAYGQWNEVWRKHATEHSRYYMTDIVKYQNSGIGRAALCIANGYSFEKSLDTIKKYQHQVDIICVDKCLKPCLENGIVPKFVMVCDASVNYETYLEPVKDQLQNTTLLMNVCANPLWSANGNWLEKIFFVNKDVLKSEREWMELSGCKNVIPAGTNVSNAVIVILTQSDEMGKRNFFGYDKILTIGYDYCWDHESYYAFNKTGGGKSNYMKSIFTLSLAGQFVFSSPNLLFSAKWLRKYVETFKLPVIQCCRDALFAGFKTGNLAEQMQYLYRPEDAQTVISLLEYRRTLEAKVSALNDRMLAVGKDHYKQLIRTV